MPVVKSGQPAALLCWEVVYTAERKPRLRWSWPKWHWLSSWSTLNFWAAQLQLHPAVCTAAGMQVAARYAASSGLWVQGRPHVAITVTTVIVTSSGSTLNYSELFSSCPLPPRPCLAHTMSAPVEKNQSEKIWRTISIPHRAFSVQGLYLYVDTLWTIPKVQSWDGRWRSSHQCIGSPALYLRHSWNKMMIWPIL